MPLIDQEDLKTPNTDTFTSQSSFKSNQVPNSFSTNQNPFNAQSTNNFNQPPSQGLFQIPEKFLQLIP
jgi:hypothetical protein